MMAMLPWEELMEHAKACQAATAGAAVSLTAGPYEVHINTAGHVHIKKTRYSPDVQQCQPVPDEQQAADPYAELKAAYAAGKMIQHTGKGKNKWSALDEPKWDSPPECYRAKPEPVSEPTPQPEADGWIEWNGGECPVDGDATVHVILRSGDQGATKARYLGWSHYGGLGDVIHYRVALQGAEQAAPGADADQAKSAQSTLQTLLRRLESDLIKQAESAVDNPSFRTMLPSSKAKLYADMAKRYAELFASTKPPAPEATEEPQTVTAQSVLERAASHMAARAATYDSPGGERSMGKAVEAFNAIDRPAEASASDSETGQHAPGVKLDHGKPRAGLVLGGFARALTAVSDVGTFGAKKYTPHGWRSVPHGFDRYTDAMVRHQLAEAVGEQFDAESGLSHAAHAAWNALARLELMLSRRTQLITCALPAEAKAREAAKRA